MTKIRIFIFLITILFVFGVGWLVSLIARGYRLDTKTILKPNGLLVIDSEPNGAQIFLNGKLKSATDDSISLAPGVYEVEVKKEGYLPWKKTLTIKKEEVTQAEVYLFPNVPTLSPLTFTGAMKPILSPDRTKIAYGVPSDDEDTKKAGVWVRDLIDLPIGFSREARQITDLDPNNITIMLWSPDSRELYIETKNQKLLLPINEFTPKSQLVSISSNALAQSVKSWQKEVEKKKNEALAKLPSFMQQMLKEKVKSYVFSPNEKKVMYIAAESFLLPDRLKPPLPGSSTQKEEREVQKDKVYVYDLREDKNFLIYKSSASLNNITALDYLTADKIPQKEEKPSLYWFPTSNHIVLAEKDKISIMDYDGTNKQVVYSGPYVFPYAIPYPNPSRILFLTNLGAGEKTAPNLYFLSFK